MDDLEQQIKAWADTTMSDVDATAAPVPVVAAPAPQRRGGWLAAAAVLLAALVGAGLAMRSGDDGEHVRADDRVATTTPPTKVAFTVLGVHLTTQGRIGTLESAQTLEEVERMWNAPSPGDPGPVPEVDFTRQVVVGITIPDDACPPTLTEFIHEGGTVEPRFVEETEGCEQPLVARTYVVALDWSSTGDSFQLLFSGLRPEDDESTLDIVRAGTQPPATATTPAPADPVDVSFQELGVGDDSGRPGTLRAAQTDDELRQLRVDAGIDDRREVDFATHVVLAITVLGRDCPATLSSDPPLLGAMTRKGAEVEPQFLPVPDSCETDDVSRTFLVSVPWSETGDAFDLVLSSNVGGKTDGRLPVTREEHEPASPSKVTSSLQLDATTVPVGGTLHGTVTVVNDSGAPIEGSTCGDYFVATLGNDEYQQGVARLACLSPITIPEGTSTYPVSVTATVTGCTPVEIEATVGPACNADGSMPAMQPGDYELRIDDPMQLVPSIDPVTITVTLA